MHREQLTHVDNEGAVAEAVKLVDFMQLFKVSVAMATTTHWLSCKQAAYAHD